MRYRVPTTVLFFVFALMGLLHRTVGSDQPEKTHRLTGQCLEFCGCARVCESIFSNPDQRSACSFVAAFTVDAGQYGSVSFGGLAAAAVVPGSEAPVRGPTPGPLLYVERSASPAQAEAIRAALSERLASLAGAPFGQPRRAAVRITRTSESLGLVIEGVADLRARPITGNYGRAVQILFAPSALLPAAMLARGTAGQVADPLTGVRFDGDGRSVLYGKFDFGGHRARRKTTVAGLGRGG